QARAAGPRRGGPPEAPGAAKNAGGKLLRDFAGGPPAILPVATAPFSEPAHRPEPLAQSDAPFRHSARELLAFAAWKAGDMAAVRKWSQLVREDPESPSSLRERVDILLALAGETGKG